uniref:RAP domain-containing protein n=1 Tax=Macrostomum lignano TaxID=282301 RepID=A0A1I8HTN4_9PLAT
EQLEMSVFSNRPSSRTGSISETAIGGAGGGGSSGAGAGTEARRPGDPLLFVSHGGGDALTSSGFGGVSGNGAMASSGGRPLSTNVELKMQEELRAFSESNGGGSSGGGLPLAPPQKPEKTISFSTDLPAVGSMTSGALAAAGGGGSGGDSPGGSSDNGEAGSQQSDEGPRRLDPRQVSLEALAADPDSGEAGGGAFRQKKARKTGLSTIEMQKLISHREDTGRSCEYGIAALLNGLEILSVCEGVSSRKRRRKRRPRRADNLSKLQSGGSASGGAGKKPSFKKVIEPFMLNRCQFCNAIIEQYDEDTISLAIVCLGAFVHREPVMAAPMLMSMFSAVSKIVLHNAYSWKANQPNVIAPGNMNSVAKQFLRCSFHQLAPNGLFVQLFQTKIEYEGFFKCMVAVLVDFQEMNCFRPLEMLLEALNERKSLPQPDSLAQLMENVSAYLECLPTEPAASASWSTLLERVDIFLRRLAPCLPVSSAQFNHECVFRILHCLFRSPVINNHKTVLEPVGRVLEFLLCNCVVSLSSLVELCSACNRVFTKERDKQHVTRTAIMLLVQALKFRCSLPDENFLLLVQLVLIDAGGCVEPSLLAESLGQQLTGCQSVNTGAAELMRSSLTDCVAFIADLHTVHKLKSLKTGLSLHEDTLGAHLKSAVSQYAVIEFAQARIGEGGRQWAINKYLSWLRHPPATVQQGPREFLECLEHIRLLSWLLIGAMMHTAVTAANDSSDSGGSLCQPIPLDASTYVAEHVMVIMTGYAEHSKGSTHGSVQQMSALNFAFHLCSLWTMYCEVGIDDASQTNDARQRIMDFWGRVTPGILQLLSHAKGVRNF